MLPAGNRYNQHNFRLPLPLLAAESCLCLLQLNYVGTVVNQQLNQDAQAQQNILGQQQKADSQIQGQLNQDQQKQQDLLNKKQQNRHLLANKNRSLMSFLPKLDDQVSPAHLLT